MESRGVTGQLYIWKSEFISLPRPTWSSTLCSWFNASFASPFVKAAFTLVWIRQEGMMTFSVLHYFIIWMTQFINYIWTRSHKLHAKMLSCGDLMRNSLLRYPELSAFCSSFPNDSNTPRAFNLLSLCFVLRLMECISNCIRRYINI